MGQQALAGNTDGAGGKWSHQLVKAIYQQPVPVI